MKIIFLDIDGVLNCESTFIDNHLLRKCLCKYLDNSVESNVNIKLFTEIDFDKVLLLKYITDITGAKIVISSSWRYLKNYVFIEEKLIQMGLPIVDRTNFIHHHRGEEIRDYLSNHNVDKFIIIDDEIFSDFKDLVNYLVKTDFYDKGLDEEHVEEAVKILGKKKI